MYIQNNSSVKIKQKSVNKNDENLKFQNNLNKQSSLKSLNLKYGIILMQLNDFFKI